MLEFSSQIVPEQRSWYERVNTLAGRVLPRRAHVDWKMVYDNLSSRTVTFSRPVTSANTLRVLIEDLGKAIRIGVREAEFIQSSEALSYLMRRGDVIGWQAESAIEATSKVNPHESERMRDVASVLTQEGALVDSEWEGLFIRSIEMDNSSLLAVCLQYVNPTQEDLLLAIQSKALICLEMLCSDVRVDPNYDLPRLFYEAREYVPSKTVIVLARHPRTDIDSLNEASLSIMLFSLESEGAWPHTRDTFLHPPDVYSKLARFVYVKHPSSRTVLEYIKDNLIGETEVKQALASVLDRAKSYSVEAAPIRALLIYILYPGMSLTEHLSYLRKEDKYNTTQVSESLLLMRYVSRTQEE